MGHTNIGGTNNVNSKGLICIILLFLVIGLSISSQSDNMTIEEKLKHVKTEPLVLLGIILFAGEIGGRLSQKLLKQPAVVGFMLAGIIIGPSILNLIDTEDNIESSHGNNKVKEFVYFFQTLAVFLLLFGVGLESDLNQLMKQGKAAFLVAMFNASLSFIIGYGFCFYFISQEFIVCIIFAAALTPTSASIPVKVLQELDKSDTEENATILGAAVIDDILGLIVLVAVSSLVGEAEASPIAIGKSLIISLIYGIVYTLLSFKAIPIFSEWAEKNKSKDFGIPLILGFGLIFGIISEILFGISPAIIAFLTGVAVTKTKNIHIIEKKLEPTMALLTPIFFVTIGVMVNSTAMVKMHITLFLVLCALASISKYVGSIIGALLGGMNKKTAHRVSIGMIPRGEIAAIVATIAFTQNIITMDLFGAIIGMAIFTSAVAPPMMVQSFDQFKFEY